MKITKEIERIKEIIISCYDPDSIIIFGSYAQG